MAGKAFKWFSNWAWGPKISLDDCLSAFFSTDELKGSNRYSCDTCKRLRNGIKYANILEPPQVLCVHLKRFKHELMYTSKISNFVSFPLQGLDLSAYVHQGNVSSCSSPSSFSTSNITNNTNSINDGWSFPSNRSNNSKFHKRPLYDLVSLVCHHGNYSSGHYTTFALNRNHNNWYVYDDKIVRPVDEATVARSEAYVLFYQRRPDIVDCSSDQSDFDRYSDDTESSDQELGREAFTGGGNHCKSTSSSMFMRVLRRAFNETSISTTQQLRHRRRYAHPVQSHLIDASNDILDDIQI